MPGAGASDMTDPTLVWRHGPLAIDVQGVEIRVGLQTGRRGGWTWRRFGYGCAAGIGRHADMMLTTLLRGETTQVSHGTGTIAMRPYQDRTEHWWVDVSLSSTRQNAAGVRKHVRWPIAWRFLKVIAMLGASGPG